MRPTILVLILKNMTSNWPNCPMNSRPSVNRCQAFSYMILSSSFDPFHITPDAIDTSHYNISMKSWIFPWTFDVFRLLNPSAPDISTVLLAFEEDHPTGTYAFLLRTVDSMVHTHMPYSFMQPIEFVVFLPFCTSIPGEN